MRIDTMGAVVRAALLGFALQATAACGGGGDAPAAATAPTGPTAAGGVMGCARFHLGGKPPAMEDARMSANATYLCNRSFASMYSPATRTPLWSAEYLTRAAVDMPRGRRTDEFHPDDRVKDGPTLGDYSRSGWDRGHLAPDADMPSDLSSRESMVLTNIAPQVGRGFNRDSWASLEKTVRRQTRGGDVYVVTGVLFEGPVRATHDDGRVKVPTHFYKALYALDQNGRGRGATVFVATNSPRPRWQSLTVNQFAAVHRVDPFPTLDKALRDVNAALDGSLSAVQGGASGGAGGGTGTNGAAATGAGAGGAGSGGAGTGRNAPVYSRNSKQEIDAATFRQLYGEDPRPSDHRR